MGNSRKYKARLTAAITAGASAFSVITSCSRSTNSMSFTGESVAILAHSSRLQSDQMTRQKPANASRIAPLGRDAIRASFCDLKGRKVDGSAVRISPANRKSPTIFLIFSPSCPFCRLNLHNWRQLQNEYPSEIVWVDLSGRATSQYFSAEALPPPASVVILDELSAGQQAIDATPTTIVMDRSCAVKWLRQGVIPEHEMAELSTLLHSYPDDKVVSPK